MSFFLNRLLTDVDEVKSNHTKLTNEFEEFKKNTNDKLAEEAEKVNYLLGAKILINLVFFNYSVTVKWKSFIKAK